MSGLTHPADERRVREIVRDELAARLDVGDSALNVADGLDDRGQVLGQVPSSVFGLLLGCLRDVLHERGGDWHVAGNRSASGPWFTEAEVVRAFRDVLRRRNDAQWDERRDPQVNRFAASEQSEPTGFTARYQGAEFAFTLDGQFVGSTRIVQDDHNKTPYVARALTRYVTGAHLTARRWLQRRAWVRRAASTARPSGTTQGGAE